MRDIYSIAQKIVIILMALIFYGLYQRYQENLQLQYSLQMQLDSLRFVNLQLQNASPALPPDTIRIVRWKVRKVVKELPPDTLRDTIWVYRKLPDYYESHRFYADDFLKADLYAYAPCMVDSFRINYKLRMENIFPKVKPVFTPIAYKRQPSRWRYFFYGLGAGMLTVSLYEVLK